MDQSEDYVTYMLTKPPWLGEVTLISVMLVRVRVNQKMDEVKGVSIRAFPEMTDPLWGGSTQTVVQVKWDIGSSGKLQSHAGISLSPFLAS